MRPICDAFITDGRARPRCMRTARWRDLDATVGNRAALWCEWHARGRRVGPSRPIEHVTGCALHDGLRACTCGADDAIREMEARASALAARPPERGAREACCDESHRSGRAEGEGQGQ
jgi:hypothetical protein